MQRVAQARLEAHAVEEGRLHDQAARHDATQTWDAGLAQQQAQHYLAAAPSPAKPRPRKDRRRGGGRAAGGGERRGGAGEGGPVYSDAAEDGREDFYEEWQRQQWAQRQAQQTAQWQQWWRQQQHEAPAAMQAATPPQGPPRSAKEEQAALRAQKRLRTSMAEAALLASPLAFTGSGEQRLELPRLGRAKRGAGPGGAGVGHFEPRPTWPPSCGVHQPGMPSGAEPPPLAMSDSFLASPYAATALQAAQCSVANGQPHHSLATMEGHPPFQPYAPAAAGGTPWQVGD